MQFAGMLVYPGLSIDFMGILPPNAAHQSLCYDFGSSTSINAVYFNGGNQWMGSVPGISQFSSIPSWGQIRVIQNSMRSWECDPQTKMKTRPPNWACPVCRVWWLGLVCIPAGCLPAWNNRKDPRGTTPVHPRRVCIDEPIPSNYWIQYDRMKNDENGYQGGSAGLPNTGPLLCLSMRCLCG